MLWSFMGCFGDADVRKDTEDGGRDVSGTFLRGLSLGSSCADWQEVLVSPLGTGLLVLCNTTELRVLRR